MTSPLSLAVPADCPDNLFLCPQLSLLSVNQYVGVCKPWRYSQLVTRRAVGGCLLVLWLVSSLQIAVPFAVLLVLRGLDDKTMAKHILYDVSAIEMQVTWVGRGGEITLSHITHTHK